MRNKGLNMNCFPVVPALLLFFLCNLCSCAQPKTRENIEKKLAGKWEGLRRAIPNMEKTIKVSVSINNNNLQLNVGNEDYDYSTRIFVHTNGDTIIERRNFFNGIIGEPSYLKINYISKKELRLIFLFKYSDNFFVSDKKSGFYLKRIN